MLDNVSATDHATLTNVHMIRLDSVKCSARSSTTEMLEFMAYQELQNGCRNILESGKLSKRSLSVLKKLVKI